MDKRILDVGPQWPVQSIEETCLEEAATKGEEVWAWSHNLPELKDLADLLLYLDACKVAPRQFVEYNLYRYNVGRLTWLKELEKHA
jgi:hypothetical protein